MKTKKASKEFSFESYLRDLQCIPALSTEEMSAVLTSATAGDETAQKRVVMAHLSLVVRLAYQYGGYGLPLADLVAEGNLGLLRAVELYDPSFGVAFSTYASVWIKQRMHRAITGQAHAVRIPVWRSQRLRKLDRLHDNLSAELGRDATLADLADRIGLSEENISLISAEHLRISSLDEPEESGEARELIDIERLLPGDHLAGEELREEIIAALEGLDDTELQIISLKFGLLDEPEESYREMAPRFGRSREWIRQIGEKALAKVAASLEATGALPRALVRKRKERTHRRLEALRKKRAQGVAELSLFRMALMHWIEPLFLF